MQRLLVIAPLWLAACGAGATQDTRPASTSTSSASADHDEMICRDGASAPGGSVAPRCRPRLQVESDERFTRDLVEHSREQTRIR